jgi:cytochrome c-type biogenesis protein CcmF
MIDLGHVALILAFAAAVYCAIASVVSARRGSGRFATGARIGVLATAVLYTIAMAAMVYAFVTKDFSLKIVSENASTDISAAYSFTAMYADKAGSVFFWGWLLSLFAAVLVLQKRNNDKSLMHHAISILAVVEAFFLALVTLVANVFQKNPIPPLEGFGLNPLLQNFGMLLHPPLLYIGFAGFAIVFAYVMAALIARRPAKEWIGGIRRWTLFAWCTLGIGNLLGMWWSYNELGWGGIWAWDPVENAGLMPWLLGTAFVHTIAIGRKRNYLYTWSFALIIFTFVFTLLSPFITHGGIESPLHGFLSSSYPPYILAAMIITLAGSLCLLYFRRCGFEKGEKPSSLISTEGAFLVTNIIFVALVFVIIIGVVFPQIREGLGGGKVALNRSFFDWACGPVMLVLVLFIGICSALGWRKTAWSALKRSLLFTLVPAAVAAIAVLISGVGNWYAVAVLVCGFPLLTITLELFRRTSTRHSTGGKNYLLTFLLLIWSNRPRYGGFIVHIGIILITLGVIGSTIYDVEETATLGIGDSMTIGGYQLTYDALTTEQDEVKLSSTAAISVTRGDRLIAVVRPQLNYWFYRMETFAEVAVRITAAEDLFVSMVWTSFDSSDESATFRAKVNPLVVWMWVGGAFILLGGAIAFWPERRRQSADEAKGDE